MVSSSASSFDLAGGADTIVARATPPSPGALAVVRLSGPGALRAGRLVCPRLDEAAAWRAQLVVLREASGDPIGRGVVIPYTGPASYTGEDMLEVMIHGSPALTRRVVDRFVEAGCRPAGRGEFTRRAVANGKMDLLQAEAVADLVGAETAAQLDLARRHLAGELSRRLDLLREGLVDLLARVEASLDFAAQGVELDDGGFELGRRAAVDALESLLATARLGQRIREGVRVVLVGPPNAGKSTLFNRLLLRERAIVRPEPGTTRDVIEAEIEMGGLRVVLVDTAGLGPGGDGVEREGMRRSLEAAQGADLLLVLHPFGEEGGGAVEIPSGVPALLLRTKADLAPEREKGAGLAISALTGQGWEAFERELERALAGDIEPRGGPGLNRRQAVALEEALEAVRRAPLAEAEVAAEELRGAVQRLDELLGRVCAEEVLDRIFETFCLGK